MSLNFITKLLVLLLLPLLFTAVSCNKPTEPPTEDITPGRRDYVWSVDTLKSPEGRTVPYAMWGTNASDVWAVGASYLNSYCIWHFDGISWSNYVPEQYVEPTCIWGTSNNSIWIGSSDGSLWYYNGLKWGKNSNIILPGYKKFIIQSIYGKNFNDVYAVGFADREDLNSHKAVIAHYNGNTWSLVNIPEIKQSFIQIFYDEYSTKYILASVEFPTFNSHIYIFDGTNMTEIYTPQTFVTLSKINGKIYLTKKSKIYKLQNEKFEIFLDLSSVSFLRSIRGRTEKDFFTPTLNGIEHYNGSDLKTIYNRDNSNWSSNTSIVFEKEAFFIWDDSFSTFVIHGKLKE